MYSVYAIQSQVDNRLYIGISSNVARRVKEHNKGRVFSTKGYKPWKLVYQENVGDRVAARKREKFLKSGCGKEFVKERIKNIQE